MEGERFPDPLIKDLFQLQCLHMFGGWWADMDYFMIQQRPPPIPSEKTWMLATEFERRTSAYQKAPSGVMQVGRDLVAVNLGLMWAEAGSALLEEAQNKARALWTDVHRKWTGLRTQKGYQAHQHLTQAECAKTGRARLMPPIVSSPFPRWSSKWERQLVGGRQVVGIDLPGERELVEQSSTCNVWEGCWATESSDSLCVWSFSKGSGASPNEPTDSGASPNAPTDGAAGSG